MDKAAGGVDYSMRGLKPVGPYAEQRPPASAYKRDQLMSSRLLRRVQLVGLVLAASAGLLVGPAAPQDGLEGSVRIGIIVPTIPEDATEPWQRAVATGAEHGAILGLEEHAFNAQLFGVDFDVVFETASGPADVIAAAERLLNDHGVYGVIGGYTLPEAIALGTWAEQRRVTFLNVGVQSDVLRNEMCFATAFHVEPSAAMYLDALAGWYVRAGFRRWYVVTGDDAESEALHARLSWAADTRHFGVDEVGATTLTESTDTGAALRNAIEDSRADVLILLVDAEDQLRIMRDLDAAGLDIEVVAYPYPETQTRAFFIASREAAPNLGTNHRAVSWEATIDAYGGREYNARFRLRFDGEPMDSVAWATFHAVKILFEAVFFGGASGAEAALKYMTLPTSVFDLHKGIAVTFRDWDHQLRQSMFLVKISESSENVFDMGLLVGELPAIYMPGTDPVERLDQLGDLENRSGCRF